MKVVTWNVNSIRARLPNILQWLKVHNPDVVLMQEIKCQEGDFPRESIEDLGYNICIHGQKTYHGVAILSKYPIEDALKGLPNFQEDNQARYVEAFTGGLRVASVYVPNGNTVGSEKYHYKLAFLDRLREHLGTLLSYEESIVIGGDYNIAPTDEDVGDPVSWHEKILCSSLERKAFQSLLHLGYYDAYRLSVPSNQKSTFTWWDYRSGAWEKGNGLRIDLLLLSPQATDRFQEYQVDASARGGEKASDHAPAWCVLA